MRIGSRVAKSGTRLGRAGLAVAAALVATAGCMSGVRSPLENEITKRATSETPQFDINGWTDRTGTHHKLLARARVVGDSIQLYERHYGRWGEPIQTTKLVATVPRSDVVQVDVDRFDPVKTGFFIATPAILYGLLIASILISGYEP